MKIVLLITDYGSFNNFLSEIAIKLNQEGHEVYVITSKEKVIKIEDKYDYKALGVNFVFVDFPRSFNFLQHYKISSLIQKKIEEISPDLVNLHFTTGIFTTVLKNKLKFKTIGTFHGLGYPVIDNYIKKQIFKFVEYFCISRLDETWVLNKADKELLQKKFKNINLLPTNGLGCDLTVFNRDNFSENENNELKKLLGINADDFVISFTGRFVDFKGYHIVVKAFRVLEEIYNIKNIKLITMGGRDKIHPTGLDEEEEAYLKNNKNIINIGFTKDVDKYLSITDLFFFPSKKEGIPICIVEALAMGIPVMTFDARGCNDLVVDNVNGKLLNINSTIENFAEQILNLYKNPELLKKYSINALADRNKLSRENFINFQLKQIASKKEV
jgi:glycosyltransferase involved in cell wall biosynthesis